MNYEQELFDSVTKLCDSIQYCIVYNSTGTYKQYQFVKCVNVIAEHWYYDTYHAIEFIFDDIRLCLGEDTFSVWHRNTDIKDAIYTHITDIELDITDKHSYFQYNLIEDLQGIRWEVFPLIKKIRNTFFEGISTKDFLEDGFTFI